MAKRQITYAQARERMSPGDVIAFGGRGLVSETIQFATNSRVSHVGIVMKTRVTTYDTSKYFNQVIESVTEGVTIFRCSERFAAYDGEVWWLPIKKDIRNDRFDQEAFFNFLLASKGKKYDKTQSVKAGLDALDELSFGVLGPSYNKEDFDRFFCSELVAAALGEAGVVSKTINASEVTPIDLCRWDIYRDTYYQLKGDKEVGIGRYSKMDPELWV